MTVIAYKDGIIASDSQYTTDSNIKNDCGPKILKLNDHLVGMSGQISLLHNLSTVIVSKKLGFLSSLSDLLSSLDLEEANVIAVDSQSKIFIFDETGAYFESKGTMVAIGSGAPFAYGAMQHGATAIQAVAAAMKFDIYCGGTIWALDGLHSIPFTA